MNFIFVVCLAGMASSVSMRLTDPMLPAIAGDLGVTLHQVALLTTAYSLPYAAMQLVLGPIGDAVGKVRLICVALVVVTVGLVASALAPSYGTLLAARVLVGALSGGVLPVGLALIGDRTPFAERQAVISRVLIAVIGGQFIGSAMAGMLVGWIGWRGVFWVCAVLVGMAAAAAILSLRGMTEERRMPTFRSAMAGYRSVFTNPLSRFVLGCAGVEGILTFGFFPFLAGMLIERSVGGEFEAGIILGCFSVGGILYALSARRILAVINQQKMMIIGGLSVGICYITVAIPMRWELVAGIFVVMGLSFMLLHNTLQTFATELAPSARGSAVATFAAILFFGQSMGPLLGGAILHTGGYGALFVTGGVMFALVGFIASSRIRARPPVP
jgi:MFS transporter, DHA1 family, inner membrane transport protein